MSTGENLSDSEATETTQWDSLTDYESQPEEPLTPEQKKSELTFEKVSELSTDEYIELWRRLNPFMLHMLPDKAFGIIPEWFTTPLALELFRTA